MNWHCDGIDPRTFDYRECYPDALEICSTCPTIGECLLLVNPAESWYDGVCGGIVWKDGKPQTEPNRLLPAKVEIYLSQAKRPLDPDLFDKTAMERLIRGEILFSEVSRATRHQAAIQMARRGYSRQIIATTTRLSGSTLVRLLGPANAA